MQAPTSDIAFTPAVKRAQDKHGSRSAYARMEESGGWNDKVTPALSEFIAARDSFYLGTASADGRPYIQHRGGPRGFIKVLDERTLALADYAGNAQYISMGNLSENNKAFIFLIDYPNRHRIKIWGRARFIEDDPQLLDKVRDSDYPGRVERALVFDLEAWDVNCTQHIQQRFTPEEIESVTGELSRRVRELEKENSALRKMLDDNAKPSALKSATGAAYGSRGSSPRPADQP